MDDIIMLIGVIIIMAAIVYLSYVFSRYISKGAVKLGGSSKNITVVDRLAIGQDKFVMIVKVLDQYYLMSASGQSVSILKELDAADFKVVPQNTDSNGPGSFLSAFQNFLSKKK